MNPLEVLPYDGVFRCLVRSEKSKRLYLVDLEFFGGIGKCACWQFEYRLQPKIRRLSPQQRERAGDDVRCKHILEARRVRAEQLLTEIMKQRAEKARKL